MFAHLYQSFCCCLNSVITLEHKFTSTNTPFRINAPWLLFVWLCSISATRAHFTHLSYICGQRKIFYALLITLVQQIYSISISVEWCHWYFTLPHLIETVGYLPLILMFRGGIKCMVLKKCFCFFTLYTVSNYWK